MKNLTVKIRNFTNKTNDSMTSCENRPKQKFIKIVVLGLQAHESAYMRMVSKISGA